MWTTKKPLPTEMEGYWRLEWVGEVAVFWLEDDILELATDLAGFGRSLEVLQALGDSSNLHYS